MLPVLASIFRIRGRPCYYFPPYRHPFRIHYHLRSTARDRAKANCRPLAETFYASVVAAERKIDSRNHARILLLPYLL